MPTDRVITKRLVRVVEMPAEALDCMRDPAHVGHADCPRHPHAGMAFVARYTRWSDDASLSEYLDHDGLWGANPEGALLPERFWHAVHP